MELKELIGKDELDKRIGELAKKIDEDYEGQEMVAICVLNGAAFFTVELTLKMKTKMKVEFVKISSYRGTESTGEIIKYLDIDKEKIMGKNVLIIEDIVDTGREVEVNIDYLGFEVPNQFIIGYGFDDEEGLHRNVPYIGCK